MGKKKYSHKDDISSGKVVDEDPDIPSVGPRKKLNVRARKLFHPFMLYLQSYREFAENLPRHFMQFDEEKLNDQQEEKEDSGEEEKTGEDDDSDNAPVENNHNKKKLQFGSATRAKTIVELKERLAKMRGKKLDYQERLKKKGIKSRLTKKQRLEERAKLRKEKMKTKQTKGNLFKTTTKEGENEDEKNIKPVKEPTMIFSKLELPEEEGHKKRENKDPKRLLQKIQKSESKLKMLEEKGKTDTVKRIKEKQTWDKAIQKAEGVKIKDDVELLKKTIKKKTDIKTRSKKKWDQRLESIEHRKQDSQKKRKENISKKNKEKKQKKIKRSIKKGRVVI